MEAKVRHGEEATVLSIIVANNQVALGLSSRVCQQRHRPNMKWEFEGLLNVQEQLVRSLSELTL